MGVWREVITRSSTHEPDKTGGSKSRGFYWRKGTRVTTVVLSCGHTKSYRGDHDGPKKRALCKECS